MCMLGSVADAPIHHDDLPDPLPQPALDQQRNVEHAHPLAPPPMP